MASASIEDTGGGRWRIRWREKRPEGSWAQPEVTVHGSAEDAEAYRLVVIRDLRERGHHDPAVQRARDAPPATVLDGMIAYIAAAEADGLRASSAATYRATVPLLAEAIHEVTRIPETAPLPVTLLNRTTRRAGRRRPRGPRRSGGTSPRRLRTGARWRRRSSMRMRVCVGSARAGRARTPCWPR